MACGNIVLTRWTNHIPEMRNEIFQSRLKQLVDYDPVSGIFTWVSKASKCTIVGARAGSVRPDGYRAIRLDTVRYYEHRLVWLYMHNKWPTQWIDHINMDRVDNRFCNLREAVGSQNYGNAGLRTDNTSGFKGVVWHEKASKWAARISRNGRSFHLGLFVTREEAAEAYRLAAEDYFGEFARVA